MRLLIALVIWAAAVVGAIEVSTVVAQSIHKTPGSAGGGGSADPSSIKATDSGSMFRTANLTRAMNTARSHLGSGAQLTNVALYPGYVSLSAVKHGSEAEAYVDVNGRYDETDTGGSPGSDPAFSIARITPTTPAAIAHKIDRETHVPSSQLHYMVVERDPITKKLEWLIYTVPGNHVEYFQTSGAAGSLYEYRTNSATGLQRVKG